MIEMLEKTVCPVCCLELVSPDDPCCQACQGVANDRPRCPRCHNLVEPPGTVTCGRCGLERPADGWPAPPLVFEGRYELTAELARDDAGALYLAGRDFVVGNETTRELVALRVCTEIDRRDEVSELYQGEFFTLARLGHHQDVIQVFGVERTGFKLPYMVTELAGGPSLRRVLDEEGGPLEIESAVWLGWRIAAALRRVHEQRLVHLDLRPANVFVRDWGSLRESIKLGGFGRSIERVEATHAGKLRAPALRGPFVPRYSPPELTGRALGSPAADVGPWTDVYGLGLLLYEMLTRSSPFEPEPADDAAWNEAHAGRAPVDPTERRAEVPRPLAEVVLACLARSPADRIGSASILVEALAEILLTLVLPDVRRRAEHAEERVAPAQPDTGPEPPTAPRNEPPTEPRHEPPDEVPAERLAELSSEMDAWRERARKAEALVEELRAQVQKRERELTRIRDETDEALSGHAQELAEVERRWKQELSARHRAEARVAAEQAKAEQPAGPVVLRLSNKLLSRVTARFVRVLPGTFVMGSPEDEAGRLRTRAGSSSAPVQTDFSLTDFEQAHEVTVSRPFLLQATPVTQSQFEALMGLNPSEFKGPKLPAESVSWYDAVAFCNRLSEQQGLPEPDWAYVLSDQRGQPGSHDFEATVEWRGPECPGFRLPTEAEWELSCRAGTTTATYAGDLDPGHLKDEQPNPVLDPIAWFGGNSTGTTNRVAAKLPNAWDLHDMLGNVWEWVWDWDEMYPSGPVLDPAGPGTGENRVIRGGSWSLYARFCRAAYRGRDWPGHRFNDIGFRPARTIV